MSSRTILLGVGCFSSGCDSSEWTQARSLVLAVTISLTNSDTFYILFSCFCSRPLHKECEEWIVYKIQHYLLWSLHSFPQDSVITAVFISPICLFHEFTVLTMHHSSFPGLFFWLSFLYSFLPHKLCLSFTQDEDIRLKAFPCFLVFRILDNAHKPSNFECYKPSPQPLKSLTEELLGTLLYVQSMSRCFKQVLVPWSLETMVRRGGGQLWIHCQPVRMWGGKKRICHQTMNGEDTSDWEDSMRCSALKSVWISDTCGYKI
jgi:hypothetical protein